MDRLLVGNPWFPLALGLVAYALGYYLGIVETYLYHAGAKDYVVFHGSYELTPALQEMFAKRRYVNGRLLAALGLLAAGILAVWDVSVRQYDRADLFSFLIGGLVLVELATAIRRFRNIVSFHYARSAGHLKGKVEYSSRLVHTQAFVELYGFTVLYVLSFLVTGSWFFLGGALTCFVTGRRYRDWAMVRT